VGVSVGVGVILNWLRQFSVGLGVGVGVILNWLCQFGVGVMGGRYLADAGNLENSSYV
jgi:hypothetical protein